MAELCADCPMRGSMKGKTQTLHSTPFKFHAYWYSGARDAAGEVAVFDDGQGGRTRPFLLVTNRLEQMTLLNSKIDQCAAPQEYTERRGILRREHQTSFCPAIGRLAVQDPDLLRVVMPTLEASVELHNVK